MQTRNLTILLTDIKGFTDRTSHMSRTDIQDLLDHHKAVVLPVLEGRGGKLVKTMGDAFLMVYESPTEAVLAGIAVQDALAAYNKDLPPERRIEIRVAINQGEVNLADNDIFGEPVNITARIEGIADAGEVFFTEAVYLAMNKTEVPSSEVGLLQLKGIPEKVRVYRVKRETPVGAPAGSASARPGPAPSVPGAPALRPTLRRRAAALLLDLLLCAMLADALGADKDPSRVEVGDDGVHVEYDDGEVQVKKGKVRVSKGTREKKRDFFPLFWLVYNGLFLTGLGATPGKKILKLRVEDASGAPADKKKLVARSALSLVSGAPLGLGYAWGLWDKDQRTWHDLLAGTRVVHDPAKQP